MEPSRRELLGALFALGAPACGARFASAEVAVAAAAPPSVPPPALARTSGRSVLRPCPEYPLFADHPELAARFPRQVLTDLPTPVEAHPELAREIGVGQLWIKRDDVSGEVYGGGKPRKLELILPRARQAGATRLVTAGGVGSNQAVATAAFGRALGYDVTLLLLPQVPSSLVRQNLLADLHFGAEVRFGSREPDHTARVLARSRGERVFFIPPGGSTPEGNLAFVNAAFELKRQVDAGSLEEPDVLYVAVGSSGTAVGLAVGLRAVGLRTRVVGVRCASTERSSRSHVDELRRELLRLLAASPSFPAIPELGLFIDPDQLGGGYGVPTGAGRRAVRLGARHGLTLEPVYTAKTLASLQARAHLHRRQRVLLWLTHSSRALDVGDENVRRLPESFRSYVLRAG